MKMLRTGHGLTSLALMAKFRRLLQNTQTNQSSRGSQPLVSVCIPAYKNAEFIGATLESVLNQTYRNLEIIITDDRSPDETISVARRFSDPRIRLFENTANLGVGGNWNEALSHATGKYVKLMGADDLIYPQCIERQVEALENPDHANVVLAVCNTDIINPFGRVVMRRRFRFRHGLAKGKQLIGKCVRWGTNYVGEPVVGLFKREVLALSGTYDSSNPYWLDLIFWAELLKHGDAFMDQDRLAAFRLSGGSVTTSLGFKQAAYTRSFIRKMRTDPVYRSNSLNGLCGSILALPLCLVRNFLINAWTRPEPGSPGATAGKA
jgi:glycosyltransferase involved in cell wall biosynthesis